ncbi:MAG: PDZ domain-containing protein, partial [Vicinamibacterales bacterium]
MLSTSTATQIREPQRTQSFRPERPEAGQWRGWARTLGVVAVVGVLVALGIANVVMRAKWHEVEDGVLWGARSQGVTAVDVIPLSAGDAAGVKPGDILLAVNGSPVENPGDAFEFQHRGLAGALLSYTVLRSGSREVIEVAL